MVTITLGILGTLAHFRHFSGLSGLGICNAQLIMLKLNHLVQGIFYDSLSPGAHEFVDQVPYGFFLDDYLH